MRTKSLRDVADPFLSRMLRDHEEVVHVFLACSPAGPVERILLGSGLEHVRRCVVVLTSSRIIQIAVTRALELRDAISQIAWGDIASSSTNALLRTMTVRFRGGGVQRFSGIARADLHALRSLLPALAGIGHPTAAKGRETLCPCCLASLRRGSQVCPSCRSAMKRRDKAVRLSWTWPGGGYAYLGFPQMATLAAIVESGLVILFFLSVAAAIRPGGFLAAVAVVCITIAAVEWKAAVASHTASLSEETYLDHDRGDEFRATPLQLVRAARELFQELFHAGSRRATRSAEYVWIERGTRPEPAGGSARTQHVEGVPLRAEIAFVDEKSVYSAKEAGRHERALRSIAPTLRRLLDRDEQVLMITRGSLPHRLVDMGAPSMAVLILSRRCWFVFTSRRILRITSRSIRTRRSVRALPYSAIAAVRFDASYWFAVLLRFAITLVDPKGGHESIAGLSVHAFDKVRAFLPAAIRTSRDCGDEAQNLCPSCSAPLTENVFTCSSCSARFREPSKATLLAALIPGGGYFYTGYPLLGVFAAATDAFLLIAAIGGWSLRITLTAIAVLVLHKFVCIAHAREFAQQYVSVSAA